MKVDRQSCIENIGKICAEYADILGRVILFGSVARSENTEREFRLKLFALYDGKVDYDILSFGGKRELQNIKRTLLWHQIEEDGVILYDGIEPLGA